MLAYIRVETPHEGIRIPHTKDPIRRHSVSKMKRIRCPYDVIYTKSIQYLHNTKAFDTRTNVFDIQYEGIRHPYERLPIPHTKAFDIPWRITRPGIWLWLSHDYHMTTMSPHKTVKWLSHDRPHDCRNTIARLPRYSLIVFRRQMTISHTKAFDTPMRTNSIYEGIRYPHHMNDHIDYAKAFDTPIRTNSIYEGIRCPHTNEFDNPLYKWPIQYLHMKARNILIRTIFDIHLRTPIRRHGTHRNSWTAGHV